MKHIALAVFILGATNTYAQNTKEQPCKLVKSACESAGYKTGDAKKNLWKDCIDPIVNGKSVTGVSIDTKTIAACKKQHQL